MSVVFLHTSYHCNEKILYVKILEEPRFAQKSNGGCSQKSYSGGVRLLIHQIQNSFHKWMLLLEGYWMVYGFFKNNFHRFCHMYLCTLYSVSSKRNSFNLPQTMDLSFVTIVLNRLHVHSINNNPGYAS